MSDRHLDWQLLEELECPVCVEYMASPINMCENGHNVCAGCMERLADCPTCRGTFINVRNVVLEKLAATALYPCKNKEAGCKETFGLEERGHHLSECLFQNKECPFRKLSGVDCPWTGTMYDIALHILGEHDNETAEMPRHFKVEMLDFAVGRSYGRAVCTLGELFYLAWEREIDVFSFGVFHFGPKNETNDFQYGIKISSSAEYVAVTRKCHSYFECGLKDMQPGNCVTLAYGEIQKFLGEHGNLSCEIEIGKLGLEGFVVEDMQENLQVYYAICSSEEQQRRRQEEEEEQQQHQQQQQWWFEEEEEVQRQQQQQWWCEEEEEVQQQQQQHQPQCSIM